MKILILGASGLVGKELIKNLSLTYDVYGTFNQSNLDLDSDHQIQWEINQYEKITDFIEKIKPQVIISCLRGDFDIQFEVHQKIIEKIKNTSTKLLFCSTTNVFDGEVSKHHNEYDEPKADSDYGQFKIKCENSIKKELGERGIILRLPMVWGKNSPRLKDIKEKILKSEEIEAFENIYLNHATDEMIAKQVRVIIEENLSGIFHLATSDIDSQFSFISKLVNKISNEAIIKRSLLSDIEVYNFGLLIKRTELEDMSYTINDLIRDLIV